MNRTEPQVETLRASKYRLEPIDEQAEWLAWRLSAPSRSKPKRESPNGNRRP